MLTFDEDEPTLRNAIMKRLDVEPGVRVLDIKTKAHQNHIAVGVEWLVHELVHGTSLFHIPPVFDLGHIHNEVDEIAENCKEAKRKFALHLAGLPDEGSVSERFTAKGTGPRGNWKYGERSH